MGDCLSTILRRCTTRKRTAARLGCKWSDWFDPHKGVGVNYCSCISLWFLLYRGAAVCCKSVCSWHTNLGPVTSFLTALTISSRTSALHYCPLRQWSARVRGSVQSRVVSQPTVGGRTQTRLHTEEMGKMHIKLGNSHLSSWPQSLVHRLTFSWERSSL